MIRNAWPIVLIASFFGAFVGWLMLAFKSVPPILRYVLAAAVGIGAGFFVYKMIAGNI
jgi:hypothetical protein